jgi:flavin reductase (DIM6/NTAB) family NADH-FMN oxidoreductase RutF
MNWQEARSANADGAAKGRPKGMDERWLQALGSMTHGIYVLTTHYGREMNGMIASWVSQVSYAPPLIMVAVHPNRYSHALIEKSNSFALHLLTRTQKDLVSRFKGPDPEAKFESLRWSRGETGCPVLQECIGYLDCVVKAKYVPGNHTLFIGQVLDGQMFSTDPPLTTLDYSGTYIGKD